MRFSKFSDELKCAAESIRLDAKRGGRRKNVHAHSILRFVGLAEEKESGIELVKIVREGRKRRLEREEWVCGREKGCCAVERRTGRRRRFRGR